MVLPGVSTRWISVTVLGSMNEGPLRLVSSRGPPFRDCERGSGKRIREEIGPGEHDGLRRACGRERVLRDEDRGVDAVRATEHRAVLPPWPTWVSTTSLPLPPT